MKKLLTIAILCLGLMYCSVVDVQARGNCKVKDSDVAGCWVATFEGIIPTFDDEPIEINEEVFACIEQYSGRKCFVGIFGDEEEAFGIFSGAIQGRNIRMTMPGLFSGFSEIAIFTGKLIKNNRIVGTASFFGSEFSTGTFAVEFIRIDCGESPCGHEPD